MKTILKIKKGKFVLVCNKALLLRQDHVTVELIIGTVETDPHAPGSLVYHRGSVIHY